MASFKLNIAKIRACPPAKELVEAMAEFAMPDNEEFGVLQSSTSGESAFATIIRKTCQNVQQLDAETNEVVTAAVEKVTVYPFGVRPSAERLEIFAGGAAGIEQVGTFLASNLALPTIVDPIEIEIASAFDILTRNVERVELRGIRVSEYAHDSYMSGPYAPKFLDSQHGLDFLAEFTEFTKSAKVRFRGPTGPVNVTLTPNACFGYSCNEDDQAEIQSILRKLA